MSEHEANKPWWKQMWPWLLISGPAIAVIGCAITIWLAYNMHADVALHEGIAKQGLKVEQVAK